MYPVVNGWEDELGISQSIVRRGGVPNQSQLEAIKEITKEAFDPEQYSFTTLSKQGNILKFKGEASAVQYFGFGENIKIANIKIENFVINTQDKEKAWAEAEIKGTGAIEIRGDEYNCNIVKKTGEEKITVAIKEETIGESTEFDFSEIGTDFKANWDNVDLASVNENFKVDEIKAMKIGAISSIDIKIGIDKSFELAVTGTINAEGEKDNLGGLHEAAVIVAITQAADEDPKIGAQFALKGISMNEQFKSLLKDEATSIELPFIGGAGMKAKLPRGQEYDVEWTLGLAQDDVAIITTGATIASGVSAGMQIGPEAIPDLGTIQSCQGLKASLGSTPLQFDVGVQEDGWFTFIVPDFKAALGEFLTCVARKKVTLPEKLFGKEGASAPFSIKQFFYKPDADPTKRGFGVTMNMPEVKLGTLFTFKDVEVTVKRDGVDGETATWDFEASAETEINTTDKDKITVSLEVTKTTGSDTFSFSVSFPSIDVNDIRNIFGIEVTSEKTVDSLKDFGIKDFKLTMDRGDGNTDFRMSGTPLVFGFDYLAFEAVVWGDKNEEGEKEEVEEVNNAAISGVTSQTAQTEKAPQIAAKAANGTQVVDKARKDAKDEKVAQAPAKTAEPAKMAAPPPVAASTAAAPVSPAAPPPPANQPVLKPTLSQIVQTRQGRTQIAPGPANMYSSRSKIRNSRDVQDNTTGADQKRGIAQLVNKNMIFAIVLKNMPFDELMEKIHGEKGNKTYPFIKDMDAYVVLSNTDQEPPEPGKRSTIPGQAVAPKRRSKKIRFRRMWERKHSKRGPLTRAYSRSTIKSASDVDKWIDNILDRATKISTRAKKVAGRSMIADDGEDADSGNDEAPPCEPNDDDDCEEPQHFNLEELKGVDIKKGLTMSIKATFPKKEECKKDSMCEWISDRNQGQESSVEIVGVVGVGYYSLSAKMTLAVEIAKNWKFTSVELEVVLDVANLDDSGISVSAGITWMVETKNEVGTYTDTLDFSGTISVSFSGSIELQFDMSGIWKKAFGAPTLSFGNVLLSMGIDVKNPTLPSIEFGMEIWLGNVVIGDDEKDEKLNDHLIKAKGYFGINPANPLENYFYADISALTLESIGNAYNFSVASLPAPVRDMGFPNGLTIAFTSNPDGKELEDQDITIEKGIYIKGTLRIFGFDIHGELQIDGSTIAATLCMDPLNIMGDIIQVRRSSDDMENGPLASIEIGEDEKKFNVDGYASIMGVATEIHIKYEAAKMEFEISATWFDIITAQLKFEAEFSTNINELSFKFNGCVTADIDKLVSVITDKIGNLAKAAEKATAEASASIEQAKASLDNIDKIVAAWTQEIDDYQERLKARAEQIKQEKQNLKNMCDSACGWTCVPFFGWNAKCFKIWGKWVGCPGWERCKWKVKDIICMAGCELKKMAKKVVLWGESVGIDIMLGLSELGKQLLKSAETVKAAFKFVLDIADGLNKLVGAAVAAGMKLAAEAVKYVGSKVQINHFCIGGELSKGFKACANLDVDAELFGKKIAFKGEKCFNLGFHNAIAEDTVEKVQPGSKQQETKLEQANGQKAELSKKQKDASKQKSRTQGDIDSGLKKKKVKGTNKSNKRSTVLTKEDMYYRQIFEEPVYYNHRSAATMHAYENGAPWKLANAFELQVDDLPISTGVKEEMGSTRGLDPCASVHHVIGKYSALADGYDVFARSSLEQVEERDQTKKEYTRALYDMKQEISDVESKKNMTNSDRDDLYFWYHEMKNGIDKWTHDSERFLFDGHKRGIIAFKNQFDAIVKSEKNFNTRSYIEHLHETGINSFKRSSIPGTKEQSGEQDLNNIKKNLLDLITDQGSDIKQLHKTVMVAKQQIAEFKKKSTVCKA